MRNKIIEDNVVVVNSDDIVVSLCPKTEAHKRGVLHRAVSVFVINSNGEWLIQRRALEKYHSPGLWSNTCCTHPLPDESYHSAALRALKKEMGMYCEINYLFDFIYKAKLEGDMIEHELDHLFIGFSDKLPIVNTDEVCEYRYIHPDELRSSIISSPEIYTEWFKIVFERVYKELLLTPQMKV
ncbi:MAG: isopentenyl-diphosphate Delta-isomerase [Bacteroidales bacterium]